MILKEGSGMKRIECVVQKMKDQEAKEDLCERCWVKAETEKEETQVFFFCHQEKESIPFALITFRSSNFISTVLFVLKTSTFSPMEQ